MKKIIISTIAIAAALSMNSCADFLQPTTEGSYASDTYFSNDQQAIDAVDACYYRFLEEGYLGREMMWEQAVANDFVWGRTRSWPELATLSLTTSVSPLNDVWGNIYSTISRSNWVVNSLLNKQKKTELTAIEKRSLGEAYFCRCLAHLHVAYRYGTGEQGVPFVRFEDFEEGYNNQIPTQQKSVCDNYRMIVEDLDKAEALLPRCEEYSDADFGRAHKAACAGLKARVYTYWACWDKSQYANVITEVNKMEKEYGRSIEGVAFTDNFTSDYSKWRNSEYVWAIPSEGGVKGQYGGVEFPGVSLDNGLYGLFNCWGQFKPSLDAYEELCKDNAYVADSEKGNIRLKNSIAEYGDKIELWGMTDFHFYSTRDVEAGFMFIKYAEPFCHGEGYYKEDGTWVVTKSAVDLGYVGDNSNWPVCRMNFPLQRFADCMLLRAEAYLANNDPAAATKDINAIRARANLKPLAGNATWTDLYHERRAELMFEHSDHAYDCKRWAVGGNAEIKALALAELNTHPRARHYAVRANPGQYVDGVFVPNTEFTVGPYEDYQNPAPKWEDYKIAFPYRSEEISKANGALKQNKGYN